MHFWKYALPTVVCFIASPAISAELSSAEIKALISGNTAYVETTAASATGTPGKGMIYYSADGTAIYKTPRGEIWHGTWQIKDNMNCTDWKESPNNPCNKYDKQGDVVNIVNSKTGEIRARFVKIAPGNPEKLAP
jgi:hypothetical protein